MKNVNKTIDNHLKDMLTKELLSYDDLPSMELYMEQLIQTLDVLLRIKKVSSFDQTLTQAMVNNYVKDDMLDHPVKKKYGKDHFAKLIEIGLLKDVLDIKDVKALVSDTSDTEGDYNQFVNKFNTELKKKIRNVKKDLAKFEENNLDQINDLMLSLAIDSVVNIILTKQILEITRIYKDLNE